MEQVFDLSAALAHYIVGQKRTGANKQFVFMRGEDVVKGPYQQKRLTNVLDRTAVFDSWQTPCVVKPLSCLTSKDGTFIQYPNIMADYKLEYEDYLETFTGLQYFILKSAPVIDVGHAINNKSNSWIPSVAEDLILGLCHCNIVGVGDMNLRNILVDPAKRVLYIIDFDDNLGKDRDDEMFYFNKPPAKKLKWYEQVAGHYTKVANRLTPLLTDPIVISNNLQPRVERAINLLRKYGTITQPEKILTIVNGKVIIKPEVKTEIKTEVKTEVKTIAEPSISDPKNGQMVWKGIRGAASKTFSGVDFDVAKSALQKYIRRGMTEKALLVAIELYRLGEVGGDAGVTNMYNRLAIIANEDIGPANLALVLEVTRLVESGDRDINKLAAIVQLMSESAKTRLMSHAWRAYATPEGRLLAPKYMIPIDTDYNDSDLTYISENSKSSIFLESDPESIRPYILIFYKRLYEKDFNALSWAYFYLETVKDMTLAKRKKCIDTTIKGTTGKATILLWKVLSYFLAPEVHDALIQAYYNHTENKPFISNAILIALYSVTYTKMNLESNIAVWNQHPYLHQMLNGELKLEIDPFVIDKHTSKGRSMGMNIQDFVDEGAVVENQDVQYYNKTLADLYKERY